MSCRQKAGEKLHLQGGTPIPPPQPRLDPGLPSSPSSPRSLGVLQATPCGRDQGGHSQSSAPSVPPLPSRGTPSPPPTTSPGHLGRESSGPSWGPSVSPTRVLPSAGKYTGPWRAVGKISLGMESPHTREGPRQGCAHDHRILGSCLVSTARGHASRPAFWGPGNPQDAGPTLRNPPVPQD